MKTTEEGLKMIREFEGLRLTTYLDVGNVPTIGYGHTGDDVKLGMKIDEAKAMYLFMEDVAKFEQYVQNLIFAALNPNQFSALVSFIYNVGNVTFVKSLMPKYLNAGNYEAASNVFPKYAAAASKHNDGLYRRRLAERALFVKPVVDDTKSSTV